MAQGSLEEKSVPEKKSHFYIVIAIIAAFAGLLFGYDTGVISGAILFIKKDFDLSATMNGFVVSAVLIGAFFGSLLCGKLASIFGRKNILIVTALIFALGSILSALSPNVETLIGARIIVGIAIGISSYVAPIYISEIAPPDFRGALVALNQVAIAAGIFISYIIDFLFALYGEWRWMLALGVIPSACLFFGMFFLPYSPRWLASKGKSEEALEILKRVRGKSAEVETELAQIEKSLKQQEGGLKMLFSKNIRTALFISMGLMFVQQITGINTIVYYAPTIFELGGFDQATVAILATMSVGAAIFIFTVISLPLIDLWGRRPLLFLGLIGMSIGLLAIALMFYLKNHHGITIPALSVGGILVYIAAFSLSLGPIAWVIISEVFPLKVRGYGSSLGVATNWFTNWVVTFTFLTLVNTIGADWTFFAYFVVCILAILFIYFVIPETKGVSLERIEENLIAGKPARRLGKN